MRDKSNLQFSVAPVAVIGSAAAISGMFIHKKQQKRLTAENELKNMQSDIIAIRAYLFRMCSIAKWFYAFALCYLCVTSLVGFLFVGAMLTFDYVEWNFYVKARTKQNQQAHNSAIDE